MATRNQAGFSLVELILALAITSSLAVLAFAGQRGLRSQAQFDADVNKLVSSIADAHNEATAAVNLDGPGDGTQDCLTNPAGPAGQTYVFAGVAWSAIDAPGGGTYRMDFYAANRTTQVACAFDSTVFSIPSAVRVNKAPGTGLARSLFIRDDIGGLTVCSVTSVATNVLASFGAGVCKLPGAVGNAILTLNLSDADGHTSVIQVDPSGLAKRVN